ncbi:scaffolding protein [Mycobacterium phage Sneeze]|uniref:Scaffolding protein n=1 Tax=Mycobacterium phage Rabbs TaxID=2530143 RepID=A0A481VSL6_9CAUD|nr:scaffolding protein [Mycobacterium phage Sneeze]YP_010051351.1 scaffolding protein [Mycobacterium phage Rabbs]ANU79720.1 scaffolding protein [Mycobacterium phage Sneeze]QBI96760.1 scaffolding protein [Mycobacterium phage Rabbs]
MANQANNAGGDQSQAGEQDQQNNQDQGAAGGNGGDSGNREYEQLPDDHPLVKRLEALKAENKVLKPKAKLVDDAEEAKKTDAQKIADLQTKVDALPKQVAEGLREHLVELHGIDKDDAELFLTGDTPELLLKQVARLLESSGTGGTKRKNYVQKEGNHQRKPAENENAAFAKGLFGGSDD